jgi:cytochrome bd-type quinol oxidase subunit 1
VKQPMHNSVDQTNPVPESNAITTRTGGWRASIMAILLIVVLLADFIPLQYALQPHLGHSDRRLLAILLSLMIPVPWVVGVVGYLRLKELVSRTGRDPEILELVSALAIPLFGSVYAVVIPAVEGLFSCWK